LRVDPALPASPQVVENNTHSVHSDSPKEASLPANVEDESSGGHQSENDANTRYNINKALGINPCERKVVQARRKEVTEFLLIEYNIRLNKPYTKWPNKTWIASVNATFKHFSAIYGWKRKAVEDLLKLICEDNVRNGRKLSKKRALEGAEASSTTNPPASKKRSVLTESGNPKKKTLLRRPNRKAGSQVQSASTNAGRENSAETQRDIISPTPGPSAEPTFSTASQVQSASANAGRENSAETPRDIISPTPGPSMDDVEAAEPTFSTASVRTAHSPFMNNGLTFT
jgi:hypothetical protein